MESELVATAFTAMEDLSGIKLSPGDTLKPKIAADLRKLFGHIVSGVEQGTGCDILQAFFIMFGIALGMWPGEQDCQVHQLALAAANLRGKFMQLADNEVTQELV